MVALSVLLFATPYPAIIRNFHFSVMLYVNLSVELNSTTYIIVSDVSSNTSCNPGTKHTLPELLKFTCPDGRVVSTFLWK